MDDIRDSAAFAVSQLGWEKLKELKLPHLLPVRMFLRSFQPAMGKAYAMHVYHYSSIIQLEDSQRSIAIVVTPLTAIMEDQVSQV